MSHRFLSVKVHLSQGANLSYDSTITSAIMILYLVENADTKKGEAGLESVGAGADDC